MPMQATTTTPLFSAQLTPHRSLGKRGGMLLFGLGTSLAVLPGLAVVAELPWLPVIGLMLADIVAIGLTLFLSLRTGRRREQITVWSDQIEWTATNAKGTKVLRRFDPRTVRLQLDRDADEKTTTIRLRNGKDELEVGAFLAADDKSSFAKALGTALRKARAA
ncbi:DUF2244 domain-containing protein [Devosia sp. SL43]|uniref:DUF2244 domain-containing protein n=1 Tax=Devosia sp. SL43 TaxID=2806348 RepID=UPI001F19D62A|nr:DUF2244 domain-containing protein [Devosia sp. SL43]UJW84355.1 DUF2244 domain-containing protein [Devosia sp. SL43]